MSFHLTHKGRKERVREREVNTARAWRWEAAWQALQVISTTGLQTRRWGVEGDEPKGSVWTHVKGLIVIPRCLMFSCKLQGTEE